MFDRPRAAFLIRPFFSSFLQGQRQDLHGREQGVHMDIEDPTFFSGFSFARFSSFFLFSFLSVSFFWLFKVNDRRSLRHSSWNVLDLGIFVHLIHLLKWWNKGPSGTDNGPPTIHL